MTSRTPAAIGHLTRHLLSLAAVMVIGCQAAPPPSHTDAPPATAPVANATPANPAAPSAPATQTSTADLLAAKASNYAHDVGPLLDKRGQTGATATPASDNPDASTPPAPPVSPKTDAPTQIASAGNPLPSRDTHSGPDAISSAVKDALTPPHDPPTPTTNPAPSPTDPLSRRLAQRVHDDPQDLAGQLDFQLAQLIGGEQSPQLATLAPLAVEDRELVSAVVDGLSNFRDAVRADNNMLLSKKVKPLLDMADRLRGQAELTIPTIALCRKVDRYGVYEPIQGQRFIAGRDQAVIVYCEVENFASQLNDAKLWETKLHQEIVLYTEQTGLEVWRDKQTGPMIDNSRTRRHDFFMAKMIHLPASLTIGRYLLKVSVEDLQVNRIAENTVAIEMVAE